MAVSPSGPFGVYVVLLVVLEHKHAVEAAQLPRREKAEKIAKVILLKFELAERCTVPMVSNIVFNNSSTYRL